MKYKFCTLFDKNYLPHVLSLCDSLEKNASSFIIYCFCMDDESFQYLRNIKRNAIIPISHRVLESHYPELIIAKSNRSAVEYYFTCSSAICSFVFDCYPETELVTYLDADLYFFSSPEPIFDELMDASVGIIEHRFSFFGKRYEKFGRFNVGWVSFRNDLSGRKCLEEWREDCIDWCYDRLEDGKFGDQKYLDYWSGKYTDVHIIQHLGANLAPWNVGNFLLKIEPISKQIMVNEQNLIFYHFAGFKQLDSTKYITYVSRYFVSLSGVLRNSIYLPYLTSIIKYNKELGIKFSVKNRKEYTKIDLGNKMKQYSRNFRQFICKDYLNI